MAREFNDRLARAILIGDVLAGAVWTLYIIFKPKEAFAGLQGVDVKWLILVVGNILIIVLGLLLYSRLYFPRVKRLCLTVNRAIWGVGILLTAFPFALRQISVNVEQKTMDIDTSVVGAGVDSATIFITMVVGGYFMTRMYHRIAEQEVKLGVEL